MRSIRIICHNRNDNFETTVNGTDAEIFDLYVGQDICIGDNHFARCVAIAFTRDGEGNEGWQDINVAKQQLIALGAPASALNTITGAGLRHHPYCKAEDTILKKYYYGCLSHYGVMGELFGTDSQQHHRGHNLPTCMLWEGTHQQVLVPDTVKYLLAGAAEWIIKSHQDFGLQKEDIVDDLEAALGDDMPDTSEMVTVEDESAEADLAKISDDLEYAQTLEELNPHPHAPEAKTGRNIPFVYSGWSIVEMQQEHLRLWGFIDPQGSDETDIAYADRLRDELRQEYIRRNT